MISAGLLKWNATRMSASNTQDALGLRSDSFTAAQTFRCDLRPTGSSESPYADGVVVRRNFEIRARWPRISSIGLKEIDRISVDGRTLRIHTITDLDGAQRVAVIQCR